jgi:hypothetical protein
MFKKIGNLIWILYNKWVVLDLYESKFNLFANYWFRFLTQNFIRINLLGLERKRGWTDWHSFHPRSLKNEVRDEITSWIGLGNMCYTSILRLIFLHLFPLTWIYINDCMKTHHPGFSNIFLMMVCGTQQLL